MLAQFPLAVWVITYNLIIFAQPLESRKQMSGCSDTTQVMRLNYYC